MTKGERRSHIVPGTLSCGKASCSDNVRDFYGSITDTSGSVIDYKELLHEYFRAANAGEDVKAVMDEILLCEPQIAKLYRAWAVKEIRAKPLQAANRAAAGHLSSFSRGRFGR